MSSNSADAKKKYFYKLFRVRRSDGRVTTVSVDIVLVTHAVKKMGGLKSVGKFVRETALVYEDGTYKSCSGYVARALEQEMTAASAARALAAASPQLSA